MPQYNRIDDLEEAFAALNDHLGYIFPRANQLTADTARLIGNCRGLRARFGYVPQVLIDALHRIVHLIESETREIAQRDAELTAFRNHYGCEPADYGDAHVF